MLRRRVCAATTALFAFVLPALCAAQVPAPSTPVQPAQPTPPCRPLPPPDAPARRYAGGSISLTTALTFSATDTFGATAGGTTSGTTGGTLTSLQFAPRLVSPRGFTVQPALTTALGTSASTTTFGGTTTQTESVSWSLGAGVGLGWAFAVSSHVALTPMLSGAFSVGVASTTVTPPPSSMFRAPPSPPVYTLGLELPVTVFVGHNAFFEPFVRAQGSFVDTTGRTQLAVVVGQRFGWTF